MPCDVCPFMASSNRCAAVRPTSWRSMSTVDKGTRTWADIMSLLSKPMRATSSGTRRRRPWPHPRLVALGAGGERRGHYAALEDLDRATADLVLRPAPVRSEG